VTDHDEADDEIAVGAVDANLRSVRRYLTHPQGGGLSEAEAIRLMDKHAILIQKGERARSFANYVGDQILRAEGLPEGEG
jgi:hypothetical protein